MRVGLVCPYDLSKPGGVQSQVKDLARRLEAWGDEVRVIGPGLPADLPGVDLGRSVVVPGNRSRVPLSPNPTVGRDIARAARRLDLLHVHEPLMPFASLGALRAGRPVVATFHAAPGPLALALYKLAGPGLGRILGPHVRRVTAVSPTAAAPLGDYLDVAIVPNGVDVASFDIHHGRKPLQVAFLGRDERRKGLDVLLEAWPRVIAEVPGAELVVMGAKRSASSIDWRGIVDEEGKREGLATSSIYVAPNLGGESFGVVLVEAMAAGAAVVASDLPSFREVGGDAARYFEAGNSSQLADMLIELLGHPGVVEAMSRVGVERAREFDWETVAASYRELYEQAVS